MAAAADQSRRVRKRCSPAQVGGKGEGDGAAVVREHSTLAAPDTRKAIYEMEIVGPLIPVRRQGEERPPGSYRRRGYDTA